MAEPFVGEIKMFAGNFAPRDYALCDGQLVAISQNTALFALLGTTYGGDGQTTFALPDLRGRVPIHQGTGPGLSPRTIGQNGGSETHTLTANEVPHTHALSVSASAAGSTNPAGNALATSTSSSIYGDAVGPTMRADTLASAGGNQPHSNVMPFQCINFIVALFGIFPSRN
jgi:microcystin-dependent protein